jgi:hypothetical protein
MSSAQKTASSIELPQELQIILEKQTEIVHSILQHGEPLDPHAKRVARELFRVNVDIQQYVRMHHAATENLEPAAGLG